MGVEPVFSAAAFPDRIPEIELRWTQMKVCVPLARAKKLIPVYTF
jgi:hypothetical protein